MIDKNGEKIKVGDLIIKINRSHHATSIGRVRTYVVTREDNGYMYIQSSKQEKELKLMGNEKDVEIINKKRFFL